MESRILNEMPVDLDKDLIIKPAKFDSQFRRMPLQVNFQLPSQKRGDSIADNLPDIEENDELELKQLWDIDPENKKRPMKRLVEAIKSHYQVIHPYFYYLKNKNPMWNDCWIFLYKIALDLDDLIEEFEDERAYHENIELSEKKHRLEYEVKYNEETYEKAKEDYQNELDRRQNDIIQLNDLIERTKQAIAPSTLQDIKKDRHEIRLKSLAFNNKPTRQNSANVGCLSKLSSLFTKKETSVSEAPKFEIKPIANLDSEKEKMINEYQKEIDITIKEMNDVPSPAMSLEKHHELEKIIALAKAQEVHYYHSLNKSIMLHCIRLYVIAFRTYYQVYGENPMSTDAEIEEAKKSKIAKIRDLDDAIMDKAKSVFKQLIQNMKYHFDQLYCMQPDECYFSTYLHRYNTIQDKLDRDTILRGVESPSLLELVFPEYETPQEASKPIYHTQ